MRKLTAAEGILFAELAERAYHAEFDHQFPLNGQFSMEKRPTREREMKEYWYYQGYRKASDGNPGVRYRMYVGPAGDPELEKRIERFKTLKGDARERSRMGTQLKSMGNPAPGPLEGGIVKVLAEEGIFRMRSIIVGSMAYQTYGSLIGVKLPLAQMMTQDVDFAQDHGISISIDDRTGNLLEALQRYDETFRPAPQVNDSTNSTTYANAQNFRVDFITSDRASDEVGDRATTLPSLGGVGAVPLRHIDYLIKDPVRAVILHESGVSVRVPQPARYAVHKMIVSGMRHESGREKAAKDLRQAHDLILAHDLPRRGHDIAEAWIEAWERGPRWREELAKAALRLEPDAREILSRNVTRVSDSHGFQADAEPSRAISCTLKPRSAAQSAKAPGDLVGITVTRTDVEDALQTIRTGATSHTPQARLLTTFKDGIVQPEWRRRSDGKFAKTRKILSGEEALANLLAIFGHVDNMKVFLHPEKSEPALAMADPDIANLYQAAVETPANALSTTAVGKGP